MPYIFHGEAENNEAMVTRIIHADDYATEEDKQTGIHFESIPEADPQMGKVALLYTLILKLTNCFINTLTDH
jgi:hypothetical protein